VYLANYQGPDGPLMQGVVCLPGEPGAVAPWNAEWHEMLSTVLVIPEDIPDVRVAIRVVASGARLARYVLLLSPAAHEDRLRRHMAAFTRLERIAGDSVLLAQSRDEHDEWLADFPGFRCLTNADDYEVSSPWLCCPFRVLGCAVDLIVRGHALGYEIGYQANVVSGQPGSGAVRESRRNLVRVELQERVPEPVVRAQKRAVDGLRNAVAFVEEYLAAGTPSGADWCSSYLRQQFSRSDSRHFEAPEFEDSPGVWEDAIATGALAAMPSSPSTRSLCNRALTADDLDALLREVSSLAVAPLPAQQPSQTGDHGGPPRRPPETSGPSPVAGEPLPTTEASDGFIFVSYKREEFPRIARILKQVIGWGYYIWYDRGIPGGTDWDDVIESRIAGCGAVVVFLSPAAVGSRFVRREVKLADALGKRIIPVFVEDAPLLMGLALLLNERQGLRVADSDFLAQMQKALRTHGLEPRPPGKGP